MAPDGPDPMDLSVEMLGREEVAIRKLAPNADGVLFPLAALLNGIGYVFIVRIDDGHGPDDLLLHVGKLAPADSVRAGSVALIADPSGAVIAVQKWPVEDDERMGMR